MAFLFEESKSQSLGTKPVPPLGTIAGTGVADLRISITSQIHLEYRKTGFHWRRRLPQALRAWGGPQSCKKMSLIFPLRSHVIPEAKALALKLTLLSDIAFAGLTERTMAIAPHTMECILTELCRFIIDAAEAAREIAPCRTPEVAAYELACANAAIDTLRHAISLRDRAPALEPLRHVAQNLGIVLEENDPDWQRLAFRALRVMLDAQQENLRRDQGNFSDPSTALQLARSLIDGAPDLPSAASSIHWNAVSRTPNKASCTPLEPPVEKHYVPPEASTAGLIQQTEPTPAPAIAVAKPVAEAPSPLSDSPDTLEDCPTIRKGSETYISLRSKGYKNFKSKEQANDKAGASWARNSAPNVRATAFLFNRILGDKRFDQISDTELTASWELVARLPRSYQAKTSKLSPQQAADDADATEQNNREITSARLKKKGASPGKIESEVLKDRIPRLRTATIYRHMQDFQRICVFLRKKGHLSSNIMEDHIWDSAEYDRRDILEEDNERLTWCGKLDGLLRSAIFQDELDDAGDPMFWAPLIALHMGLRSEEVLQLYLTDVQVIDDVPCIVLRQGPGQSLKSRASRRTVPIHDNLLKLGLMQLIEVRKREDETRLFPWVERSASKKTFTETFSKRFTRYRQDHGIYDDQRDFHSFRTTFNHLLIEAECPDTQRRGLMGHVERDVGITNYNPSGFSKVLLRKRVNSVVIDISMIRPPFGEVNTQSVTHLSDHRKVMPA